ncbi:MAG: DegT/DnrJ/EryC1/StrS family aminotransferase [Marivibrio sp.]|uniref:DegT/DnrJ/EryC1/StrS family aminotransferase n=1 Tax=Marivibrio sp. TaxID=2039719 RepID=UPI0032EB7E3A
MTDKDTIAFVDLKAQYEFLKPAIDQAIHAVLQHGAFIMGPEVAELESDLAAFTGTRNVVGCSSGTDALLMIMMAEGVGPGDAIFVPSFTFTATAEVPLLLGATPVFVDVDEDDFNLSLEDLERRIGDVKSAGRLNPRGVLATDLFGLPMDYDAVHDLARRHDLTVWADAAQSFGGMYQNKRVGSLCRATATSFFPAKPLGCYGDGGAVFTDDDDLAQSLRSIRAHGKGGAKYDIVRVGLNARLDTVQAAVLRAKLPSFADEIDRRSAIADDYDALIGDAAVTPARRPARRSAWAQYTLRIDGNRRDAVADALKQEGVPNAVYYPMPMHLQTAYRHLGDGEGSLPVSERLSKEVLSLPMHPFLSTAQVERIAGAVVRCVRASAPC